ncbi:hypothetical protein L6164_031693 [Bauhinia variegata]|uniref:Uncharacterized protein n=1 Tax=Bauhinia variegata TaxID=167791 RepID=A0ACB9LGR4_BAUVA|nr:hypothetical protein L6164_031693 [Bauhinia variegata]
MKSLCCDPTPASSFENLKELELRECPSLKSLFTLAVAQSLKMLQALMIIECDRLKHIISDADADKDDQKSISAFPKLEQLFVKDCVDLECLGGHCSFNLCKLKRLFIESCSRAKSLFTASTARTMTSLEELIIRKCDSLEEVFGICHDEDSQALTLPRLKILTLIELPKLVKVSHEFKLQRVINVLVEGRPMFLQGAINDTVKGPPMFPQGAINGKVMGPPMFYGPNANFRPQDRIPDEIKCITDTTRHVGAFFPVFTKLTIRRLHDMESSWIDRAPTSSFVKLKELELYDCPSLKSLFTVAVAQSLEMLHVMMITKCNSLQHIITTDDDQKSISAFPNLQVLYVCDCENLEHLGGHWSFNLCNLKRIFIQSCSRVKSLFTTSTAKTMTSLDELIIKNCDSLVEVFGVPRGEESQALMLPRLKMLALVKLPNLIVVSHEFVLQRAINVVVDGRYTPMFPGPVGGFQNFLSQNPDEINCITDTTRHVGAFFPGFTKLAIRRLHSMESLCWGPTQAGSFHKIKELEFSDCPSLKSLFTVAVAQSLQMLQILKITECRRLKHIIGDADVNAKEEIITVDDHQKCTNAFPKLELLMVQECKDLEYLGGHWLLNLCSLKKLNVTYCRSLKSLFTLSTAKTMTSLEELFIKKCSSLKEVFGVPSGEDGGALALPGLKMITFIRLPNLIEVSHEFRLQHVINAVVKDCPKFHGPVDYFQNLTQGQNPELDSESEFETESESEFEFETESEEEEELTIGQSIARSQESCEVHNAQAGTSNMSNTASSSGEVDAVQGSSTNISKEHRDVKQTSSVASLAATNQDVTSSTLITPLDQEHQTPAIKASNTNEATAVQRSSTKEDRDFIPQTSLAQDANLNGEDQRDSSKKEMGSTYNLPMHHGENVENGDDHSASKIKGTATEEPRLQTVKEPVQVEATLKIDQSVHGINFRKGEDMVRQEHDTSSNAENAARDTSKEYVQEHFPISEKYSAATSLLGGKDFDSKIATNQDANLSTSLAKTNPEYQTQEVITGVGGQLHTTGLYARIIPIGTLDKLQEHDIPPTGSLHLIEIIGETTMVSAQKGLQSEKSTVEISSLELVEKAFDSQPISMDHQDEAFEVNKVSPGDMPTGLDLHVATEQDKNELHFDNVNTGTGSSGKATLELPSSLPVAQNVDIATPSVIPAPIQTPASSVSFASLQALPTQVEPMMCSTNGKFFMIPDEEYATFRDIVAIKKKHIPLLEKAISSYPSLWAWHEKPMRPKMKQFGYSVLGDMLEFLESTKWTDLTEERKAEFLSLLDELEILGFDTQWLTNTCVRIKKSNAMNRMKMLEQQAMALKSELQKTKLELDGIEVELKNLNNFIGF